MHMRKGNVLPIPETSPGQARKITFNFFPLAHQRTGSVLPIALMALAIVGFLLMVDYSISGGKWPWSVNKNAVTSVLPTANMNSVINDGSASSSASIDGSVDFSALESQRGNAEGASFVIGRVKDVSGNILSETRLKVVDDYFLAKFQISSTGESGVFETYGLRDNGTENFLGSATINLNVSVTDGYANVDTAPSSTETVDWNTYTNTSLGFSFKYPPTYSEKETDSLPYFDSLNGQIAVRIFDRVLDPNNIQGLYGDIDSDRITKVKLGVQDGYQYTSGDGSCGGPWIQTPIGKKILNVQFTSCEGDTEPWLSKNGGLRSTILSTFTFIK